MNTTTERQEKTCLQIRECLEIRISQALRIDREQMPSLSVSELVSLLFGVHGHLNVLGGYGQTASAILSLIGEDLFWRRRKICPEEPAASTLVH